VSLKCTTKSHSLMVTSSLDSITFTRTLHSMKTKLKDVTFTLNSKPSGGLPAHLRTLMWCDCVPKAKRNKPVKVNGILVSEVQVYHVL
jgi:hypothetical protein